MADTVPVGQYKNNIYRMFADLHSCRFAMAELIELAKVASVMHAADHTYSFWSTC